MHLRILVFVFLFLFAFTISNAQVFQVSGTVKDTSGVSLERANVMAKSDSSLKFTMVNHLGQYKLELKTGQKYEVSVSYIGYKNQTFEIQAGTKSHEIHFRLKPDERQLTEVQINYEYKPVEIKKDTIVFNVGAFTSGTERKLKDVLEKLPGMEVDQNGLVSFQGNQINTTLVENKKFFGGGSKLAVDNIPGDAVGQIEIISHFSETAFMKDVLGSDQVAMNVKLKADRKSLLFGDLAASGSNKHYHGRGALFFFTPERSVSFIGDLNNTGSPAFTLTDMISFQGGISQFLRQSNRPSFTNFNNFTAKRNSYRDDTQFSALNFNTDLQKKWNVSGFAIFSNHATENRQTERIDYLTDLPIVETRTSNGDQRDLLALANFKLEHSPNEHEKLYYNAQAQINDAKGQKTLSSYSRIGDRRLQTDIEDQNFTLAQYFEWHKGYDARHTTSIVANHTYENLSPDLVVISNQVFLPELLQLEDDITYQLKQVQNKKDNRIGLLIKHYWKFNGSNQFDSHIAINQHHSTLDYTNSQLMSDESVQPVDNVLLGNTLRYQLSEVSAGLDFKFNIRSLTNTASLTGHLYHLDLLQEDGNRTDAFRLIIPKWKSEYEFNQAERLNFDYEYGNAFPSESYLNSRYLIQAYNVIRQGDPSLTNERYHSASLRYFRFSMYQGMNLNIMVNYIRKAKAIRDQIEVRGIEQLLSPLNSNHAENNFTGRGKISRKFGLFQPSFSVQSSWFEYGQTINALTSINSRLYQSYTVGVKTLNKVGPVVSADYTKAYNRLSGQSTINISNDSFNARIDYRFLSSWTFNTDFEYYQTRNSVSSSEEPYVSLNGSIRYEFANSAWSLTLSVNNALNNRITMRNSFSDYLAMEQASYVLPRIFLFGISYKL